MTGVLCATGLDGYTRRSKMDNNEILERTYKAMEAVEGASLEEQLTIASYLLQSIAVCHAMEQPQDKAALITSLGEAHNLMIEAIKSVKAEKQ